jgi:phosphohistidine swiveling domain-containing protein
MNHLIKKYTFWSNVDNDFQKNISFDHVLVKDINQEALQNNTYTKLKSLEDQILKFYGYNDYLNVLKNTNAEILDQTDLKLIQNYNQFLNEFSKEIFSYIVYCCLSEAAHSNFLEDSMDYQSNNSLKIFIQSILDKTYTKADLYWDKFEKFKKTSDFKNFYSNPSKFTLKEYLEERYEYNIPNDFFKEIYPNGKPIQLKASDYSNYKVVGTKAKKSFHTFVNLMAQIVELKKNESYDGDSGTLQKYLMKKSILERTNFQEMTVHELLKNLGIFFRRYFSSGYGGNRWAEIAEHALAFSQGKINAEIFLDKAMSLEHNGGNIFNKSFIYHNYDESSISLQSYRDKEDYSYYGQISLPMTKFLLNLQSSSSVLSIYKLVKFKEKYDNLSHNEQQKLLQNNLKLGKFIQQNTDFFIDLKTLVKQNKTFFDSLKPEILENSSPFNFLNLLLEINRTQNHDSPSQSKHLLEQQSNYDFFNHLVENNYKTFSNENQSKVISNSTTEPTFAVYDLTDPQNAFLTKNDIGGKAKGISDLIIDGFDVPKAMVFDTKTCISYLANKKHFRQEMKRYKDAFLNYLQDEDNTPILVSVRSGAPISMPGMMDTILNVGIDDTTYDALVNKYDKKMIDECAITFMKSFCSSKLGLDIKFPKTLSKATDLFATILIKNDIPCNRKNNFPLDIFQQIQYSTEAVFDSWNSERAIAWRKEKGIDSKMGTATTIQKMVFGNKNENSFTSVIFSRDCITGKKGILGEYLIKAQGEELVSGKETPLPIQNLQKTHPDVYQKIVSISEALEKKHQAVQDIEITVEDNKVYVLQKRNAVISKEAQILLAKEMKLNILDNIHPEVLLNSSKVQTKEEPVCSGLSANTGILTGVVVKNEKDIQKYQGKNMIFFAEQSLPEHVNTMIKTQAFITKNGGSTCHAAILARSINKPCIVGIGKTEFQSGDILTIDANQGKIWKGELPIISESDKIKKLANVILKTKKIDIKNIQFQDVKIESWYYKFANDKIKTKPQMKRFLSIAQQAALVVIKDHQMKQQKKINAKVKSL